MTDVAGGEKPLTKAQKKNLRKKQKRKETKLNEYAFEIEEVTSAMSEAQISDATATTTQDTVEQEVEPVPMVDTSKKIRNIKKKLKQIEELEEKLNMGELNPNKEQLAKMSRKGEYLEEIKALSALS